MRYRISAIALLGSAIGIVASTAQSLVSRSPLPIQALALLGSLALLALFQLGLDFIPWRNDRRQRRRPGLPRRAALPRITNERDAAWTGLRQPQPSQSDADDAGPRLP